MQLRRDFELSPRLLFSPLATCMDKDVKKISIASHGNGDWLAKL